MLERISRIRLRTSIRKEPSASLHQNLEFAPKMRLWTGEIAFFRIKFMLDVWFLFETLLRIFFISAKEALQIRLQEARGQPPNIHTEDYFNRYLEYQQFEKKLEHCLSSTAVRTKFASHTSRGKDIVTQEGNMIGAKKHFNRRIRTF